MNINQDRLNIASKILAQGIITNNMISSNDIVYYTEHFLPKLYLAVFNAEQTIKRERLMKHEEHKKTFEYKIMSKYPEEVNKKYAEYGLLLDEKEMCKMIAKEKGEI